MNEYQLFAGTEFEVPDSTEDSGHSCACGCGAFVPRNRHGRPRLYLSEAHRSRAARQRKAARVVTMPIEESAVFGAIYDALTIRGESLHWWQEMRAPEEIQVVRAVSKSGLGLPEFLKALASLQNAE